MQTTVFASDDIARIVSEIGLDRLMDEAIDSIDRACRRAAEDGFTVPVRSGFEYETPRMGLVEWMPALCIGERIVIKVVGYHPDNPGVLGVPTILSTVLVLDPASGHLSSVVDGTFLTALRTGAASALATRYLASSSATTLGLVGAGAQSVTQLHGISRVLDLQRVLYCDVDADTCASFSDRTKVLGLDAVACDEASVSEVAAAAHVLCTATSVGIGVGPVIVDANLSPALHVNAVGSDFPGKTELPKSLLERALVVPDFRQQAVREGECQQIDDEAIGPDLCTLVHDPDAYAAHRDRPTVFDSTGWALEDYAVAVMLTAYGEQIGCGRTMDLESVCPDPKDPYGFLGEADAAVALRAAR